MSGVLTNQWRGLNTCNIIMQVYNELPEKHRLTQESLGDSFSNTTGILSMNSIQVLCSIAKDDKG